MKKLILFTSIILYFPLMAQEYQYDPVFFENSLMQNSHYHSSASYQSPSYVQHINHKLPVQDSLFFTPGNALVLHYVSNPEGQWKAVLNFPEWRGKDFLKKADVLHFSLYVGSNTEVSELPQVAIGTHPDTLSNTLPMAQYIQDFGQDSWIRIRIPLQDFQGLDDQDSQSLKAVAFTQASQDGKDHLLYLDQVELLPNDLPALSQQALPQLSQAKGYERHIDIEWQPATVEGIKYIKIYRSVDNQNYEPVGIQNPYCHRYTDFFGKTDQKYFYKIKYVGYHYQESAFSNAVSAETYAMTDEQLLDMVQEACFRYYWDGAEPHSGLALENIPGRHHMVASGASGFGLMALLVGVDRGFITREQAIERFIRIVNFLEKADKFHGAFSHFIDGRTGKVVPFFGDLDDGGDLVETSFLMQGLLAARQYFNQNNPQEQMIRDKITQLWEGVEWDWYKKTEDSQYLFWHWSPDHAWEINHKLIGWNEVMITYLLAIASPTHPVTPDMYYTGWASQEEEAIQYRKNWGKTEDGSQYANGNTYFGITLDAGVSTGGPLFFIHYSFLGLDPHGLKDCYTEYFSNNQNIALINYRYCIENPHNFLYYGEDCWGLTASDGPWGYMAQEPVARMDKGTVAPTGAIASFPYTPEHSMDALKNYYRNYGHFLWGEYGFRDAFNLSEDWCANIYMGLNQAPIVVMIENYRSGLVWNSFMRNPEIKEMIEKVFE